MTTIAIVIASAPFVVSKFVVSKVRRVEPSSGSHQPMAAALPVAVDHASGC
jgi:hypothetical protein